MNEAVNIPQLRFPEFTKALRRKSLGDFGYFYYGKSAPKWSVTEDAKTPCVRYGELYSTFGEYILDIKSHTNIPPENLKFSKGGEVLVPRVGEDPLDFAYCSFLPISDVAIGEMISVYNTKESGLFFTYYINSKLKKAFARVVEGGNVSNLYYKYLENINVTIPSLDEQDKIIDFLSAVDNKIELLRQKQELLGEYKKGLMQQIFSQAIRFKADDGSAFPVWKEKKLGDILDYEQPTNYIVDSTEYDNSFDMPVLTAGKSFILGYTNETHKVFENIPVIIFDDFTTANKYVDFPFKVKSSAMKILKPKDSFVNIRLIFEFIQMLNFPIGEHKRYWISEYQDLKIPFPSFEEQTKIASFLSSIDNKIEQVGKQLDESKQFKKALLQQMFV